MEKLLLFIAMSLLITSCSTEGNNEKGTQGSDDVQMEKEIAKEIEERTLEQQITAADLRTTDQIEDWLADLATAVNQRDFEVSEAFEVSWKGKTYNVTIVNPDGAVQVIRGAIPNWENREEGFRYITRFDELILLENLKKTSEGFEAYKFYYTFGRFLEAQTASAESMEELRRSVPEKFDPPANDFRRNADSVMNRHGQLMEQLKLSVR